MAEEKKLNKMRLSKTSQLDIVKSVEMSVFSSSTETFTFFKKKKESSVYYKNDEDKKKQTSLRIKINSITYARTWAAD